MGRSCDCSFQLNMSAQQSHVFKPLNCCLCSASSERREGFEEGYSEGNAPQPGTRQTGHRDPWPKPEPIICMFPNKEDFLFQVLLVNEMK